MCKSHNIPWNHNSLSFSIGYSKEEIKRLRFTISEFESLTSIIKNRKMCLRGQNEDAEKKAYELRQQLDEMKGICCNNLPHVQLSDTL